MDGTRGYYAKRNKSIRERQLSYGFTHMWKIRNRAVEHRRREGKLSGKKSERETNHETLNHRKTEGCWRGGSGGMG